MHEYWITEIHKGARGEITRVIAHQNTHSPSLVNRSEFTVGEVVDRMLRGDKFFTATRKLGNHGAFAKVSPIDYELTIMGQKKNTGLENLPEF